MPHYLKAKHRFQSFFWEKSCTVFVANKMIDPTFLGAYSTLPTFTYSIYGGGRRDWFLYRNQELCIKHPTVMLYVCIMMINSQGLWENEAHWMKGNSGDVNKGIVYKMCEIEGNVQEVCRVLRVASEWIKQGGDTEPEEDTSGEKRWERDRRNDCSHVSAWKLRLGQTRCMIILLPEVIK